MKIILNNNIELSPLIVTGETRYIQGANRDTLNFIFSNAEDIKELDSLFNSDNCETITIISDDNSENIHNGYTIRAGLSKISVEVNQETENNPAVFEDRITVSMSQRAYIENQLSALQEAVEMLCMPDLE